jgi:hypothetical protein
VVRLDRIANIALVILGRYRLTIPVPSLLCCDTISELVLQRYRQRSNAKISHVSGERPGPMLHMSADALEEFRSPSPYSRSSQPSRTHRRLALCSVRWLPAVTLMDCISHPVANSGVLHVALHVAPCLDLKQFNTQPPSTRLLQMRFHDYL